MALFLICCSCGRQYCLPNISPIPLKSWRLLMRTTACTERVCHLQHYSQVVPAHTTLQTIYRLTVSITGLQRPHSDGEAYEDVKKPRYIIVKNPMLVFMLNVRNYITVSRAVCKLYLRQKKENYIQKSDFPFSFLSLYAKFWQYNTTFQEIKEKYSL